MITVLELAFVLTMLGVCAFCAALQPTDTATREALAQRTAEAEILADVCQQGRTR